MTCCIVIPGASGGGGSALGLENYQTAQDVSVFSTGSGAYVSTGKTLVTPALPAGDYRIGVAYQCNCTVLGEGHWRVRLDGSSNVWPTDHVQDFGNDDDWVFPAYRSRVITLGAGVHTFDLQSRQTGGEITTTRDSYFEVWRVPPSLAGDSIDPCACDVQADEDAYSLTTTPQLAGRTFSPGALPAGTYRLAVSLNYHITGGSAFDWNVRRISGALEWATNYRGRARGGSGFDGAARYTVREITLAAPASPQWDLELSSDSTTAANLGQTTWTLHRVS